MASLTFLGLASRVGAALSLFFPTASSSRSFVFRVLALCDVLKNCTHCHVRTNQPCFGEKKRYGNKRKKNLSCRYTWCSFLVHYCIMIISILTSFAHAQYCFIVRNAPRLRCTIWQKYMRLYIMILSSFMYSICGRIENSPCEIAYVPLITKTLLVSHAT